MRSEGYSTWSVCLLSDISPLEHLFVLKILSRTQRATEVKYFYGVFSETAPLQRYTTSCVVGYCSDIRCTFSTAEPSKCPKKANNKPNSTWNTTRCKVASFFLFSLRLLPKDFRILPVNVIISSAWAFKDLHMCTRVCRGWSKVESHTSLALLPRSVSWCKLWDKARDHGFQGTRSLQVILRTLTIPSHIDEPCPLYDFVTPKGTQAANHIFSHISCGVKHLLKILSDDDKDSDIFSVGKELKRLHHVYNL